MRVINMGNKTVWVVVVILVLVGLYYWSQPVAPVELAPEESAPVAEEDISAGELSEEAPLE